MHIEAQRIALTLRAINYNVGVQMYTMVFITTLKEISSISHALTGEGDVVQSGVIAITDSQNGRWLIVGTLTFILVVYVHLHA